METEQCTSFCKQQRKNITLIKKKGSTEKLNNVRYTSRYLKSINPAQKRMPNDYSWLEDFDELNQLKLTE